MNRREAIRSVAILLGTAVSASTLSALNGCVSGPKNYALQAPETKDLLSEIAETIIPTTNTPGAKAGGVDKFIITMLNDCYKPEDQQRVLDGLKSIDEASKKQFGNSFMDLKPEQREQVLTAIDKERVEYNKQPKQEGAGPHYFQVLKELTLLGYFTSKPGATEALRYVAVPGKFDPCLPYKKGDKAWAT
ncbi:twin-arginine translocation pathway signal protein [Chitinophaga parva]|uniref:Twin-arginine translocation pathway signal protein n=1 Tax=Chitinophaga parva TaxID=2169414 RepID=A0A2T7BI83_9BACT|nr:gluconate 2-dehydrogenase subunit 3 family protein [Chitinophaga parva]PUZ25995.1 twin-arginine translocation pathway signal protein [Chitinophaga parva]